MIVSARVRRIFCGMAGAFLGLPSGCQSDEGALDPPTPSVAERGGGVVAVSPVAHGFCRGKTAREMRLP
jgi:hypothetical protein